MGQAPGVPPATDEVGPGGRGARAPTDEADPAKALLKKKKKKKKKKKGREKRLAHRLGRAPDRIV